MNRTRFVLLCTALLAAACGPVNQPLTCDNDEGCDGVLVCREHFCTMPVTADAGRRDAGHDIVDAGPINLDPVDAGFDAGTPVQEDAGVVDAGAVDAGIDAGPVFVDAGPVFVDAGPSCIPLVETCNGLDDDCDGFADDSVDLSGFDAGIADAGFAQTAPGQCERGVGACKVSGALVCSNGGITCDAVPTAAGAEICNGIDDDCDGEVDEVGAGLCGITGQLCTAGACGCPSGTQVCGTSCQVVGSSCSVGVGACRRNGIEQCTGGAVRCDATPGAPAAESCNGLDDDCDAQTDEADPGICSIQGEVCSNSTCACPSGQGSCSGICRVLIPEVCDGIDNNCVGGIDEGVQVGCYLDGDNDGYRDNGQVALMCPAANGDCPGGYVSTTSANPVDCEPGNASRYRSVSSFNDSDGDLWCSGTPSDDCVGAGPRPGRAFAVNCIGQNDCNESDRNTWRMQDQRKDTDIDGFCTGGTMSQCLGSTPTVGYRFSAQCGSGIDCDDNQRLAYTMVTARRDFDSDGYCAVGVESVCASPTYLPPGYKLHASCNQTASDCKDDNNQANVTCNIVNGYSTTSSSQDCFGGPAQILVNLGTVTFCPAGFHLEAAAAAVSSGGGSCEMINPTRIRQTCNVFEGTTCRVVGNCKAN